MWVQRIAEGLWSSLTGKKLLLCVLIAFLGIHIFILVLPQAPVSPDDTLAFSRWLAESRLVLGPWGKPLAALGLLSMRASLWMRLLLALLTLIVLARCSLLWELWGDLTVSLRWAHSLICAGGILFVVGWSMQTLWGWTEVDLLAWPHTPLVVPGRQRELPPTAGGLRLWNGVYGLYLLPKGEGIGLEARAFDDQARPLLLSFSTREQSQTQLKLALTHRDPEAYFALSDAGLIFRVNARPDIQHAYVQIQAYRSASGEFLTETVLEGRRGQMTVDGVQLEFESYALPRFAAVYNPGAPLQVLGAVLLVWGSILQLRARESTRVDSEAQPPSSEDLCEQKSDEGVSNVSSVSS